MNTDLVYTEFKKDHLVALKNFDCSHPINGRAVWSDEVNSWIKNETTNAVLEDIITYQVEVWLYKNSGGEIVGFGSMASRVWVGAEPEDPIRVNVLWYLGIDTRFQGCPRDQLKGNRYFDHIFNDLVAKALDRKTGGELLGLFVHPENPARNRYEALGFEYLEDQFEKSEVTQVDYPAMIADPSELKVVPGQLPRVEG